jgi:hypothetical protein
MDWVIAIVIFIVGLLLTPSLIKTLKSSASGKGRFGGAAMAFGLSLLWALDPPKAAAIENIQIKKDAGDEDEAAGDKP